MATGHERNAPPIDETAPTTEAMLMYEDDLPRSIEEVRATFESIADSFDETRTSAWPSVESFVQDAPHGSTALDLACGNARHSLDLVDRFDTVVGIDLSRSLLRLARDNIPSSRLSLIEASATDLPLRGDTIDLALYIAAIHHLPDRHRRIASLNELDRVLTTGAVALVSAWSIYHDRFNHTEAVDTIVDWTLPSGETVERFYHLYDTATFEAELDASRLDIDRVWVDTGNCFAVVRPGEE